MNEVSQFKDLDSFFYYGQQDLSYENKYDLYNLVVSTKNNMFYFREYGSGVSEYINYPVGFMIDIGIKFCIVNSIARRNMTVTDGRNNSKDRQIICSQTSISVEHNDREGNVDVQVEYFNKFDLGSNNALASMSIPVGALA